jgi:uncharacterized protein YggE
MWVTGFPGLDARQWVVCLGIFLAAAGLTETSQAQAQSEKSSPEARVIVVGEASASAPPDYARIRGGVTTTAKTVKEATDANSKLMAAVTGALLDSGVAQNDIQTSEFSIEPVYTSKPPSDESKLSGYRVSNQVNVKIHQLAKVGEILDRLAAAGATDVGDVQFLLSDPSKVLDQAREAAVADARRKAELYARASGLNLGRVVWITESPEFAPAFAVEGRLKSAPKPAVPIQAGENTFHASVTVGFDIAQ